MALCTKKASFSYKADRRVLDEVACTIEPGALTVLVGPNGAGKSTLLRLLAGVRSPTAGTIELEDTNLATIPATARAAKIAFIAQRTSLAFDFDVRRVVGFGRHAISNDQAPIDEALERFALTDLASTPFGTLSVGQQQRVSFARAWAQLATSDTGYLLADEPCASMDPKHASDTMQAMKELAVRGIGVGVVLHDLSTACSIADRAIVLDSSGRVLAQGSAPETLTESNLSSVFGVQMLRRSVEGLGSIVRVAR